MDASTWNTLVAALPEPHILQTYEWGQIKATLGWTPMYKTWEDAEGKTEAAALILTRRLPIRGFSSLIKIMYIPKGPILDWNNVGLRTRVVGDLQTFSRRQGALFVKIDPNVPLGTGYPGQTGARDYLLGTQVTQELSARGWCFSSEQIQFRNTLWLDLLPSEDEILSRMKQKTRYNIRLAQRKGVNVRLGKVTDFETLYRLYAETSIRDDFVIRPEVYYQRVWQAYLPPASAEPKSHPLNQPVSEPLIAEVNGEAVAGLVLFRFAGYAWFLYGMSGQKHREKMPNYLLQWEAIRHAKEAGCKFYDLWGAPDDLDENDPLCGVYRFKEGLGGEVLRTIGAWDFPARPFWYRIYTQTLPSLLSLMRRRGKAQTRRLIDAPTT